MSIANSPVTQMIFMNFFMFGDRYAAGFLKDMLEDKGHALNTLADFTAKAALRFPHTRVLYRTVDYSKVFLTLPHQQLPNFHAWM